MSLLHKVALVTGSGTGIGKGTAIELAKRGVKIAVHYNSSDKGALDTQSQIDEAGGESMIVQADVSDKSQIETMVSSIADAWGGIDILVNNAALQLNTPFFDYDEASYDRLMNINLKGYWQCIQAVVPYMKANGYGRIINISSVHGKRPTDFDVVYCMTKGGIKMLTREAAIELAKYGITVNAIAPGAVDVGKKSGKPKPIIPPGVQKERKTDPITKKFPLGRVGKPSDVGHLVSFIASDESEFLSGASIRLDGSSMLL